LRNRDKQIVELTERARADDISLVTGGVENALILELVYIEVVESEIRHDFEQLTLGVDRA